MQTQKTDARVAQLATQPDVLSRSSFALMGVYGPENGMRALVRLSSGRFKEIEPGASVPAGIVMVIDADGVIVVKNGQTQRLTLPGK